MSANPTLKKIREGLISKMTDITIQELVNQGIDPNEVKAISRREMIGYIIQAQEKTMEGIAQQIVDIVKGDMYTEYIIGEVCKELDTGPKQMATMSRELARLDREMHTLKSLIEAMLDEQDKVVANATQTHSQQDDSQVGC